MSHVAKPIVTITGISGFLGSRICFEFLKTGQYTMRGTVRSKNNEAKIAPLRKAYGPLFDQIELVEADLLDSDSIQKAVAGSTYVVHTASPVNFTPKNEDDVLKPAIEGTNAVMKACTAHGVKRCVLTSGIVAVNKMDPIDKPDYMTGFYDETCWSNPNRPEGLKVYYKSKTLAEKLAWDYIKELPEHKKLELVTVIPTLIFGPSLLPGGFTSGQFMAGYFNPKRSFVPPGFIDMVDVRDVAKIHLEAIRRPDAAYNRFLAHSERAYHLDIATALAAEFGPKGFTICTKPAKGNPE